MSVSNCKKEARECLKMRKMRAFRISLIAAALAVLTGFASYFLPQIVSRYTRNPYLLLCMQCVLFLLSFAMLGSIRQGREAWMYCSACGREPSGVQFMYWMRRGRGFRAACLFLYIRLREAAWTILLSLPGAAILASCFVYAAGQAVVLRRIALAGGSVCLAAGLVTAAFICQKYALAPILFARSPQKGVRSAVRCSCSLMDDGCAQLFRLKLSFLPLAAACVAVIPIVYVSPYYRQAKACMLRDVLRAHTI